jgi:hypothetical protein
MQNSMPQLGAFSQKLRKKTTCCVGAELDISMSKQVFATLAWLVH